MSQSVTVDSYDRKWPGNDFCGETQEQLISKNSLFFFSSKIFQMPIREK